MNFKRCLIPVTAVILLLAAVPARAGYGHRYWSRYGNVILPGKDGTGFARLVLPAPVLGRAASDLRDLRLIDDSGRETPFALDLPEAACNTAGIIPGKLLNLSSQDGATAFTLDLGRSGILHQAVNIDTSNRDFNRPVTVEGSDDAQSWAMLKNNGRIFSIPEGGGAVWKTVSYPVSNFRYLRITVVNGQENPLGIDGITVQGATAVKTTLVILPLKRFKHIDVPENRLTKVRLDLGYRNLSADSVSLYINDQLFSRQVLLLGSNDNIHWRQFGSDVIFRYQVRRTVQQKTSIELPEGTCYRYLMLTVRNGDNRPLSISRAAVYSRPVSLIFRIEPGRKYRLFFGNPKAAMPDYDLQQIYPGIAASENFIPARLGVIKARSGNPVDSNRRPWSESRTWLLTGALILTAAVLGWITLRSMRC